MRNQLLYMVYDGIINFYEGICFDLSFKIYVADNGCAIQQVVMFKEKKSDKFTVQLDKVGFCRLLFV